MAASSSADLRLWYCALRSSSGTRIHASPIELDGTASFGEGAGRRFQDGHGSKAGMAVGQRSPVLANALREVLDLRAERLGEAESRSPHVSGPVADHHLVPTAVADIQGDAAIVDLDLF